MAEKFASDVSRLLRLEFGPHGTLTHLVPGLVQGGFRPHVAIDPASRHQILQVPHRPDRASPCPRGVRAHSPRQMVQWHVDLVLDHCGRGNAGAPDGHPAINDQHAAVFAGQRLGHQRATDPGTHDNHIP